MTPPAYPNLLPPEAGAGVPDHPAVFVFDENFENPRTWSASASVEREVVQNLALLVQYNYAKGEHITRFIERNDSAFGCPWGAGLQPSGTNGIACGSSAPPIPSSTRHGTSTPSATLSATVAYASRQHRCRFSPRRD